VYYSDDGRMFHSTPPFYLEIHLDDEGRVETIYTVDECGRRLQDISGGWRREFLPKNWQPMQVIDPDLMMDVGL